MEIESDQQLGAVAATSALGQKQTFATQKGMSALRPKAEPERHVLLGARKRTHTAASWLER